eukprot:5972489-Pyramimonas_sp.AAC.2
MYGNSVLPSILYGGLAEYARVEPYIRSPDSVPSSPYSPSVLPTRVMPPPSRSSVGWDRHFHHRPPAGHIWALSAQPTYDRSRHQTAPHANSCT